MKVNKQFFETFFFSYKNLVLSISYIMILDYNLQKQNPKIFNISFLKDHRYRRSLKKVELDRDITIQLTNTLMEI